MADINLLPHEMGRNPASEKIAKKIKSYIFFEVVILIVVIGVGVGMFFVFSKYTKEANAKVTDLKRQISALESSEQKLVLLKDRVGKAREVLADDNVSENVKKFDLLLDILPGNVEIDHAEILSGKIEVTFLANDSKTLKDLLQLIITSNIYSKVEMLSLGFVDEKGFSLVLVLYI